MMMAFFAIRGIVHVDWVPQGQTVNQVYYKEVLINLHEGVGRRRLEMWKSGSWVLHQDNAPAHNALSVKTILKKHKITVSEHLPHSPDLAPCDFFISKDKVCIKRNQVQVRRSSEGKNDGVHE